MVHCKCFFWHQSEICLLKKGFWLCCGSILFSMSNELRFVNWVRLFERKCIVKWVIFFASLCWLWDFQLENLKLKKNSDDFHSNMWTNIQSCMAVVIFSKKKFQIWNFESFIFWHKFPFLGDYFRAFLASVFFFNFLPSANHDGRSFYSAPPHPP